MFELLWWQQLLLAVVFVADSVVLADLVRNEVREWRLSRRSTGRSGANIPVSGASPSVLVREPL